MIMPAPPLQGGDEESCHYVPKCREPPLPRQVRRFAVISAYFARSRTNADDSPVSRAERCLDVEVLLEIERELYLTCHLPTRRSNGQVNSSTHPRHGMYVMPVHSFWEALRAHKSQTRDWLTYNRTLAGGRFSPLKEINPSNVAQLKAICTYMLPEVSSLQTGPLVIDGTMYFTTDEGSYAIDASTCAEKWKRHRHSDTPSMLLVNRGFAYANGRLFRGAWDYARACDGSGRRPRAVGSGDRCAGTWRLDTNGTDRGERAGLHRQCRR